MKIHKIEMMIKQFKEMLKLVGWQLDYVKHTDGKGNSYFSIQITEIK